MVGSKIKSDCQSENSNFTVVSEKEKKRISYLDSARGFAILLVVIAHTIGWNFPNWKEVVLYNIDQPNNVKVAGCIWQLIYSFHMPLFFLISGYLCYKKYNSGIKDMMKGIGHKTMTLLVPYITTGFLILMLRGYYGYWFFLSLWELSVIAVLLNWFLEIINNKNHIIVDIAVIVVIFLGLRFLERYIPTQTAVGEPMKFTNYILPFFLGYIMRKYTIVDSFSKGKISWYMILFVIFFAFRYVDVNQHIVLKLVAKVGNRLLPFLGSLMFIEYFRIGIHPRLNRLMEFIGRNTMDIYIFHLFFVIQIPAVGLFWLATNTPTCITSQIVYSCVVGAVAICLSIFTASLIHRSPLISKLLFGKATHYKDMPVR